LKLDTEKGFFLGTGSINLKPKKNPIMTTQPSTDAEETPTGRTLRDVLDGPVDTKLQLIQHHAKMARLLAEEVLEEEVTDLAGKRYSRKEEGNPFRRWGSNSGSIRIDGEKVPIDVPCVRDTDAEEERSLESYQAMKSAEPGPGLMKAILLGLSQGDYQEVASQFVDGFGLSQSSVSRRFLWAGSEGSGGVRESLVGGGELPGPLNPWEAHGRRADDYLHGSYRVRLQEGARLHAGND
jgi:hypothetical protein